jgi:ABC-2 type transport system ATP-binding protein
VSNILEVTGLTKSYQDFSLANVSFILPEDCITGFIGINGSGKTTTIRTILGLAQKDAGTIKIFGKDFQAHQQEIKNRIGVVLDEGGLYGELTMAEMKSIIAPAYSNWSETDYKRYLDRFALDPRQKIAVLSKGMRLKFSLVLALSHNADLLIMDEPTSGLDPLIRSQFLEVMADYMGQGGKGVFFSTHITSDLDKVADMLILINNGEILFEQEKDSLLDKYRLVKGDAKAIHAGNKDLFLNVRITDYGFVGLTDKLSEVRRSITDVLVEKPSLEDIMLGYVEGGRN